jgi:hypothetical protein
MPKSGQQHPQDKTRELQRRLYLAAKRSKERKFHALYDRIYRPDIIKRAWMEVKANGGSAGVDEKAIEYITLKATGRRLSESRMRENLTYGLKWRRLETGLMIPRQTSTLP